MLACLPQNIMKLLADETTAPLVKELIKHNSGIKRLTDKEWLNVSAPQSSSQRLRLRGMLACLPQNIMKLLADETTAPLVKELIKHDGGIARLTENERWLKVSAPQS